jgi:hypothetical protein
MKNYKVNIDKPKPTQEEILSGRNFDALLNQYKTLPGNKPVKPLWKTGGFIGTVAAVAATVAIVAFVITGNDDAHKDSVNGNNIAGNETVHQPDEEIASSWKPTKRSVTPPLADMNVPFAKFKVNARKGGTLQYSSGSKITFQPGSFVDANGNEVKGNVEVQYREMHDAVDFFLSGVPMQYDSAGQTWQLHSAGMMEIAAFVDGKVVYLKKDKPMQVEMASAYEGTQYNLYHFDTIQGNWVFKGKDDVAPRVFDEVKASDNIAKVNKNSDDVVLWSADQVINAPVDVTAPVKADPKKHRFRVDINKNEFPEMAAYQNALFEVDETREKFDPANYKVVWESIALSRGDGNQQYMITLRKGITVVKLDVYPVLEGGDFDKAYADYQVKHEEFLRKQAEYDKWLDAQRNGVAKNNQPEVIVDVPEPSPRQNEGWVYTAGNDKESIDITRDVMRTFAVDGFGIYNCDVAGKLPQGSKVNLSVRDTDNSMFAGFTAVYHVDRNLNTVMTYHNTNPMVGFCVNTSSSNLIWAVKDGQLFFADNDQFTGLPKSGDADVKLAKVPVPLETADDMRQFFKINNAVASK